MKRTLLLLLPLLALCACRPPSPPPAAAGPAASAAPALATAAGYFDNSGRQDVLAGGQRMIVIDTPKGKFRVWTRRTGNSPRIKVLMLHGGPGASHEVFAAFDSFFPGAGIEYYMYDQLGSGFSDRPHEASLWNTARFVDEVEQVRVALGLGKEDFYLYGQSWGGLLGIEYALQHQQHLKGLVISNMMSSIPEYNRYAHDVLMPKMDQKVLAEILALEQRKDYGNPRYEELLLGNFYTEHFLRMPVEQWPAPVLRSLGAINKEIYIPMQGPSEMAASGILGNWDRSADLPRITVPTLVIGAAHDTMDPKHMQWMATQMPNARYLFCPDGSHLAQYDDQQVYMAGLLGFIADVDAGRFPASKETAR